MLFIQRKKKTIHMLHELDWTVIRLSLDSLYFCNLRCIYFPDFAHNHKVMYSPCYPYIMHVHTSIE